MKHPRHPDVLKNRVYTILKKRMKEIDDIIKAYEEASALGQRTALATVVHVEGSSYRRPGARMLVTDTGALTGAISGGCLEGDALRKALLVIHEGRNKLVTYDTTNEDDARFGVQLGCNGTIHILFEPLNEGARFNPLILLKRASAERKSTVIVTLFSLQKKQDQPGTSCFLNGQETIINDSHQNEHFPPELLNDAKRALNAQISEVKEYDQHLTAFIEVITPKLRLVIFGAGNDVIPLVRIADILGWSTIIVDGRYTHANRQRFPHVGRICVIKADAVCDEVTIDEQTALVLMTHNYKYDLEVLTQLSKMQCSYVGILGPKKKFLRMIEDLEIKGCRLPSAMMQNLFSPIGLDIGAESAEEIALSVASEIKAAFSCANVRFLRDKKESIHARSRQLSQ